MIGSAIAAAMRSSLIGVFAVTACGVAVAQAPVSQPASHATGLLPDSPADLQAIPRLPTYRAFLPESVDLSRFFPRPGSQGRQGSCVGWAVGYAARAYYASAIERRNLDHNANVPSPAYIYNAIKVPGSCAAGSHIKDALELLKIGSLSMGELPYSESTCEPVSIAQRNQATDFRIDSFYWIWDGDNRDRFLDNIKGELAQNHPVILSLRTTTAFHELRAGRIYDRATECSNEEGCFHAITAVGYNERRQAVKVINSWGRNWADQGFGWISYDVFKKDVRMAYAMRVSPPPPPQPAPTCTLTVTPATIEAGESATLTFASHHASSGMIDNGVGSIEPTGAVTVTPVRTTLYTATFSSPQGVAKCTATVAVKATPTPPGLPTIASFQASPMSIAPDQSAMLSWSVERAKSLRIDGLGAVTGNSVSVAPTSTTVYTLTAANDSGTANATATVTVLPAEFISLPEVTCGKVELAQRGGKRVVTGFVGGEDDLDKIRKAAGQLETEVDVRPWPQCEALLTLEKSLALPQSARPQVSIRKSQNNTLATGDQLVFEIETPPYPSYVHVAYVQADGSVLNLVQAGVGTFRAYAPRSRLVIGNEPGTTRRFRVTPPLGREMLIVMAARSPVFPDPRPRQETEREFLTAVRRALVLRRDSPDRAVVAAYDTIITVENATP